MITLNLTATSRDQEIIKEYLEANVNDVLAEKINSGVVILKDGKRLIRKKTLDGFMDYAYSEAQKLAEKGARYACIEAKTVFGWAIHFFEEDTIEGTLFNEDGTPYEPPKPVISKKPSVPYVPATPKPKPQISFFDMLDGAEIENASTTETEISETEDVIADEHEAEIEAEIEPEQTFTENILLDAEPTELIKIDETHYADSDGVVQIIEPAATGSDTHLDVLQQLLGDTFILRGAK